MKITNIAIFPIDNSTTYRLTDGGLTDFIRDIDDIFDDTFDETFN
jgi:hypothetical protein